MWGLVHNRPFSKILECANPLYFLAPLLPLKAHGQAKNLARPELPRWYVSDVSWVAAILFLSPQVRVVPGLSTARESAILSEAVA